MLKTASRAFDNLNAARYMPSPEMQCFGRNVHEYVIIPRAGTVFTTSVQHEAHRHAAPPVVAVATIARTINL
jgi:hypothetical protein